MGTLCIDSDSLHSDVAGQRTAAFDRKQTCKKSVQKPADRLTRVWTDQEAFMRLLQAKRGFPTFPVDVRTKAGQRLVKEIAYDACHELHEAVDHLKNSKLHRATEVRAFDRAAFLEELVDAFKFVLEVAILAGATTDEFFAAYEQKTALNKKRLVEGY